MNLMQMITRQATGLLAMALIATVTPGLAASPDAVGTPIEDGSVEREIAINSTTRFVNVQHNERVRFINTQNGQRMDWQFDTLRVSSVIAFQPVAKNLLGQQQLTVYISPDSQRCGH